MFPTSSSRKSNRMRTLSNESESIRKPRRVLKGIRSSKSSRTAVKSASSLSRVSSAIRRHYSAPRGKNDETRTAVPLDSRKRRRARADASRRSLVAESALGRGRSVGRLQLDHRGKGARSGSPREDGKG